MSGWALFSPLFDSSVERRCVKSTGSAFAATSTSPTLQHVQKIVLRWPKFSTSTVSALCTRLLTNVPLIPYTQTSPRRCQSINYLVLHNRECPQMNRYQNQTRTSPSPTWGHLPYGKPSAVNKWTCVRVRGCVLPYIVSFNLDSNIKLKNKYIFLALCYSMAFHDLQHIRKLTQDHLPVNSCIYCWR